MNCYGKTDLFFTKKKFREAKQLCRSCPKLNECRDWGLRYEEFGVWGGLDPNQRKRVRKELGIKFSALLPSSKAAHNNCGTNAGYYALLKASENRQVWCSKCREAHKVYVTERNWLRAQGR
jgi:hypothetical protein